MNCLRSVLFMGVVVFVLLATLPGNYLPLQSGLDPSWIYAANWLPHSDYVYGRDFISPYGPLGFLLVTQDVGPNLMLAIFFWLAVQLLLGTLLVRFYRNGLATGAVIFGFAFVAAASTGLWAEYHLIIITALCCVGALAGEKVSSMRFFALAAGVLSGVGFFIKLSIALSAVAILCIFTVAALRRKSPDWKLPALPWIGFFVVLLPLSLHFFPAAGDWSMWIREWLSIGSELSVAMSLSGSNSAVALALFVLALVSFALLRQMPPHRWTAMFLIAPLILAFRHGFSRQDGHVTAFFATVAVAATVPLLFWSIQPHGRFLRTTAASVAVGISLIAGLVYQSLPPLSVAAYLRNVTGVTGFKKVASCVRLGRTRAELAIQSRTATAGSVLPAKWLLKLRNRGVWVDSLPWELSIIPANRLNWRPNPALQLFGAYTRELDLRTARHFGSGRAPDYIVAEHGAVDGRSMLFETPEVWRSILSRYRLDDSDRPGRRLLLRRDPRDRLAPPRSIGSRIGRFDEEIRVPHSPHLVLVNLRFQLVPLGQLAKTFFRVSPIWIAVQTQSGRRERYRILPATSPGGLILSPLVTDIKSLETLFETMHGEQTSSIWLMCENPHEYKDMIEIEFLEVKTVDL